MRPLFCLYSESISTKKFNLGETEVMYGSFHTYRITTRLLQPHIGSLFREDYFLSCFIKKLKMMTSNTVCAEKWYRNFADASLLL